MSSAQAQAADAAASRPASAAEALPQFEFLSKSAVSPTLSEAWRAAWRQQELPEKYFYVLGSTPSRDVAITTAAKVNAALLAGSVATDPGMASGTFTSKVLQVEGKKGWFVVLGNQLDKDAALALKAGATAQAAKGLTLDWVAGSKYPKIGDRKDAVNLLADGPIVPAKHLVQP